MFGETGYSSEFQGRFGVFGEAVQTDRPRGLMDDVCGELGDVKHCERIFWDVDKEASRTGRCRDTRLQDILNSNSTLLCLILYVVSPRAIRDLFLHPEISEHENA